MSNASTSLGPPIHSKQNLIEHIAGGCKPKSAWRIGTEHEKFPFRLNTHDQVPYDGLNGIRDLLQGMQVYGWQPVYEKDNVIALKRDQAAISLEPGGQFELSGAPFPSLHETYAELQQHLREVHEAGAKLDIGFLGLGFNPIAKRADVHWMPKGRYRIMRAEMQRYGSLGLDMMLRTCTVQVNLDYASEADMVMKARVAAALQPIATAVFAASPFADGKLSGFNSTRMNVWTDTDPRRCGFPQFFFEPGFGFERYVDYALSVPMYFVYRDGSYIDATGQMFGDFMQGTLACYPDQQPHISDWADHLSTLFPDVRIKTYIETRGADCGPLAHLQALPSFWVGLLYDDTALRDAWELVKDWTAADRQLLHDMVPRHGLNTPFRSDTVRDIALIALKLAINGLKARHLGEEVYLDYLSHILKRNSNYSDDLIARFNNEWKNDMMHVYEGCRL